MSPTNPQLAELRRRHGGTWLLVFVVEGFDETFEQHVGVKHSQNFALLAARNVLSTQLGIPKKFIHLQTIKAT